MYDPDSKGDRLARESISNYYKSHKVDIKPDNIIITASSSESYNLLFNRLTKPKDNVLLPLPSYPLFEYLLKFNRLELRFYKMPIEKNFQIDIDSIIQNIDNKTKMIVLISPNNPTGQTISSENIAKILQICSENNIMLISDEVFSEFVYTNPYNLPRPSAIESDALVFTLNGISKMFASPDLKLGWIGITGNAKKVNRVVERLEIANDIFLNCNNLSQYILPKLFEKGINFQQEMVEKINDNRKTLIEILSKNSYIQFVPPNSGIHSTIKINGLDNEFSDEDFTIELLNKKSVYVHPGYFYSIEDGLYIMLSFLKIQNDFIEGLQRIDSFIKSLF
jgi:aspartate/methionine/tyrosine aminotransferase